MDLVGVFLSTRFTGRLFMIYYALYQILKTSMIDRQLHLSL